MTGNRLISGVRTACAAIPCFFFALAGIAKLHDPYSAAVFVSNSLSMPLTRSFEIVRIIAVGEFLLAMLIALASHRSRLPAYLAMCLLAFFMGLLVRVINLSPLASSCGCFGSLMGEQLGTNLWLQVYVDTALLAILGVHALSFRRGSRPAVTEVVA